MEERLTQITLVEKGVHELQPGEMTLHPINDCWYIGCPGTCAGAGNLCGHTIVRIGTDMSVSPSILCMSCGAHYFVEQSQIRWC